MMDHLLNFLDETNEFVGEICAVMFFINLPGGLGRENDKGCLQMNCVYLIICI